MSDLTPEGLALLDKIAPAPPADAQELHARAARGRRAMFRSEIERVEQAAAHRATLDTLAFARDLKETP